MSLGLIDKKNSPPMVFYTRFGIHTFFMSYPIDVLVLDKNKQVKKIKKNLKPNRFFFYNPKYITVIELDKGFVDTNKIRLGDKIDFDQ